MAACQTRIFAWSLNLEFTLHAEQGCVGPNLFRDDLDFAKRRCGRTNLVHGLDIAYDNFSSHRVIHSQNRRRADERSTDGKNWGFERLVWRESSRGHQLCLLCLGGSEQAMSGEAIGARRVRARTAVLQMLIALLIVGTPLAMTRFYEFDSPLWRALMGHRRVDPETLHLQGEFVENNLGTAREADGSYTLRMIAQQYMFVPHCVRIPAGVPVHLRLTKIGRA